MEKTKKRKIKYIVISSSLVLMSIFVNLYTKEEIKSVGVEYNKLFGTETTSAQSCTITTQTYGDSCIGGTELAFLQVHWTNETYPGNGGTQRTEYYGNTALENNQQYCASLGGTCWSVDNYQHSEYGSWEETYDTYRCFSGSTGVTPDGSEDGAISYESHYYNAEIFTCTGSPSAPSTPVITTGYTYNTYVTNYNSEYGSINPAIVYMGVYSTDPQGDRINYEVDWDGNGTVDGNYGQFNSPAGFISGATIQASRQFTTAGAHTVRFRAVQANNTSLKSAWSNPATVTVTALPPATNCWKIIDLGGYQDSCAEANSPGVGGLPYWKSPQNVTYNDPGFNPSENGSGAQYSNSLSNSMPACGSGTNEGASINTSTYPNRVCYAGYSYSYDSDQTGCIASTWTHQIKADSGVCTAPPTYNCEAGQFNPLLNIISNNALTGYSLNNGVRWFNNVFYGACYYNNSGKNYFVPTKTQLEFNSFRDHLPAGIIKSNGNW